LQKSTLCLRDVRDSHDHNRQHMLCYNTCKCIHNDRNIPRTSELQRMPHTCSTLNYTLHLVCTKIANLGKSSCMDIPRASRLQRMPGPKSRLQHLGQSRGPPLQSGQGTGGGWPLSACARALCACALLVSKLGEQLCMNVALLNRSLHWAVRSSCLRTCT